MLEGLLEQRKCDLEIVTDVPRDMCPPALAARARWIDRACDVGVVQSDDLNVDAEATSRALDAWESGYARRVDEEADRIRGRSRLVLGDVPPLAFDAAAEAGVQSIALANFSWDWIYARMGLETAARSAEKAYARAGRLLELTPATPMPAFASRSQIGLLGRKARSDRGPARQRIGVADAERLVLLAFRQGVLDRSEALPLIPGVRYLLAGSSLSRSDVIRWPDQCSFEDAVVAADAVVAKPGYGIVGDTAVNGTPLLYVERKGFPEDEYLEAWLERQPCNRKLTATSFLTGRWREDLGASLEEPRPAPLDADAVSAGVQVLSGALGD